MSPHALPAARDLLDGFLCFRWPLLVVSPAVVCVRYPSFHSARVIKQGSGLSVHVV